MIEAPRDALPREAEADAVSAAHWRRTRRLALTMLVCWLVLVLLLPLAAPSLEAVSVLGQPLGFYVSAQGALLALAAIVFLMAGLQRRIDRDTAAPDAPPADEPAHP